MNKSLQAKKARTFLSLHINSELLVLPNIWNPIGARILQAKGYPAVATASAAISTSLGYEDGEKIKFSTLMDIISQIVRSVDIPVTVDIESGFSDSISGLEDTIIQVLDAGVVGINIEDGLEEGGPLRPINEQCMRIATIRDISIKQGLNLVINARIDCFLSNSFKTHEEKIEESVVRANAYSKAGADCVYPIGPDDKVTLNSLRSRISSPMNIFASASAEPLKLLHEIGINRVSFGPNILRSCLKKFIDIVDDLHNLGNYECFSKNTISRDEVKVFLMDGQEI